MWFFIKNYLQFLITSTNHHGVHSPFIYKFVTKCLYGKSNIEKWNQFLKIKHQLLDNNSLINVTDFGSGSKVFKSNKRKISKIAKVAGISNKKAKLLLKIINYFKPKDILEIGTSLGLGTSIIKIGNLESNLITLEGCSETARIANNLFKNNSLSNINIVVGDFKHTLLNTSKNRNFDCIYFDGNHTKEATLKYFNNCLPTIQNNSFWIFDDIYWNKEMKEAWNFIKLQPQVKVSVDLFYIGIIFFRKEQEKEHFKIRV